MKTAQKEKVKIYADENIPLEGVKFLRAKLHWDVRYACEEENLREKEDLYHHRRARKEGRVLLTRDRGYCRDYFAGREKHRKVYLHPFSAIPLY